LKKSECIVLLVENLPSNFGYEENQKSDTVC